MLDARGLVELTPVPVRRPKKRYRARVIEKGVGIGDLVVELERIDNVRFPIAVVVDQDLVQDVITKLVKVRAPGRTFERHIVGVDRNGIRSVRTDECVQVRAVGDRILGNFWSFAMRRHWASLTPPLGGLAPRSSPDATRAQHRDRSVPVCRPSSTLRPLRDRAHARPWGLPGSHRPSTSPAPRAYR